MTTWSEVFLGVIAAGTLAIALVLVSALVGVIVAASRITRRVDRLASHVEAELKPIVGHLNAIGGDLARAASLATAQVERADHLFNDISQRVEQTLHTVQATLSVPTREGRAFLSALRAAFDVVREMRTSRARQRAEDEDALFI